MKKITFILFYSYQYIVFPQTKRAINVDDLWAMKRIGSYDISPDGKNSCIYTYQLHF